MLLFIFCSVVAETVFLSSAYLHLFLQTNLTPDEMNSCVQDGVVTEVISDTEYTANCNETHGQRSKDERRLSTLTSVTWKVKAAAKSRLKDCNGNQLEDSQKISQTEQIYGWDYGLNIQANDSSISA